MKIPPLLGVICLALLSFSTWADESNPEKIDLFTSGDHGYRLYHIPGIVATAKGTVLAWCEARKNVIVHLSRDEGKTWPVKRSLEPGWSAYSDLAMTKAGTILCFYGRREQAGFAGDRLTVARLGLPWLLDKESWLVPHYCLR